MQGCSICYPSTYMNHVQTRARLVSAYVPPPPQPSQVAWPRRVSQAVAKVAPVKASPKMSPTKLAKAPQMNIQVSKTKSSWATGSAVRKAINSTKSSTSFPTWFADSDQVYTQPGKDDAEPVKSATDLKAMKSQSQVPVMEKKSQPKPQVAPKAILSQPKPQVPVTEKESQPKPQVPIKVAADFDYDDASTDASKESESPRTRSFPTPAEEKQLRKVEKKLREIGILEAKMQESLSTAEQNKVAQKSTLLADPVLAKRHSGN